MWTIPNQITMFRILLIPVFLVVFYLPVSWNHFGAFAVFWLAAISDALDGYLARKLNQSSAFGAFIDPVADKLMVVAALVLLIQDYQLWWISISAILMIAREIFISALREFMSSRGKRDEIAVSQMGKYKTAAQMLGIMGLIWQPDYDIPLILFHFPHEILMFIAYSFYAIATVLTFWSMLAYFKVAWPELAKQNS
ncbi:CDP-diacylglycerol--glycerol-3-phosphate 3-phosphatidyltransferase [Colwellia hornerae]|uniref:CDP-diacylglycerol--glycerol-3-phosphate 3-phosphatidyltransferase n=1 Tax=Colwellia hornerae TaxID=89402 RepID=A0A5C6QFZ2_9GAMM|nr:CDP-diacylglycerol--glycerol-3-phosphate 3-phosphatidyltransferase [Colwellia hornerae]TWX52266.1 CDP-diacylglycerol--glycerol-3-phosphate 3-phosphatidyltransferase [Colwellia hornerae]TWX57825.1 CDP-diacylglycerol--glycerol-3-phosphate 3-phosphatidyltransferase [Colwellia hornerae]TWX67527.1 CDP-diacylglycerol--glycerol-3-phosphate 3-phosphatidyltransferase [Colwellia hornerae]